MKQNIIEINGRQYAFPQVDSAVVICLDGCEPAYLDRAISAGLMPNLEKMIQTGGRYTALSAIPSFTNPNNMSIATGSPPIVHGICGNFFYNPETKQEVMMNGPEFLRVSTIFKHFYDNGAKIAVVTAKDKLRTLLGHGLAYEDNRAICFSSEKSSTTTQGEHGIDNASKWLGMPVPEVYSAKLSEFVFAAGVKLLREFKPNLIYLTTTDFIQHKYTPGETEANEFYEMFDKYLGEMLECNVSLIVTADHGMKPKHTPDGKPDVVFLQDYFDKWIGEGKARVILPITDPYVVHHGALGSFATIYIKNDAELNSVIPKLKNIAGISEVLTKQEAIKKYELPEDRIGDLVLLSVGTKTLGTSADKHELSVLTKPLRSHGGTDEQTVPFISNRKMDSLFETKPIRNFDAFYYAVKNE